LKEALAEIKDELKFFEQQEKTSEGKLIRCCDCASLDKELFCSTIQSELSKNVIDEVWECVDFKKKQHMR